MIRQLLGWLKREIGTRDWPLRTEHFWLVLELFVILGWALLFTLPYLDFDPAVVPDGREYLSAIQSHHLWTRAVQCGPCALWNGSVRGGAPAFADPHGSMLHPLVIVTTLGWGVINGSKLALVASFFLSGLAQWWLAYVLGSGSIARIWSAGMAVVAGHLAGRMELGAFGVVLSIAACSLVLPPLFLVNRTRSRSAAVLLGVMLALALVAGQGYIQVGLLFMLPAALILLPWDRQGLLLLARRYALAAGLALLLAAPFLVPFLHFLPEFAKDYDPTFRSAQPFGYVLLNLVINDHGFYWSTALYKAPFPHLNANFIGWIPVLLALVSFYGSRSRQERVTVACLAGMSLLALWVASAEPLAWLVRTLPDSWLTTQLAGIRHPSQIAAMAVPPILALAGIGLDRLLEMGWPRIRIAFPTASTPRKLELDSRWLLIAILWVALADAKDFSSVWIVTRHIGTEVPSVLEALRTPDLQWVNAPFGEHDFVEPAVSRGLKLSSGIRTWHWKARHLPEPVLEASRAGASLGMVLSTTAGDIPIYAAESPGREYATVTGWDRQVTVCTARGGGGDVDVLCDTPQGGLLIVKENSWTGWTASIDGQDAKLEPGHWLAVKVPAGAHTVEFRYRPWDVPLGILLCFIGVVLSLCCLLAETRVSRALWSRLRKGIEERVWPDRPSPSD